MERRDPPILERDELLHLAALARLSPDDATLERLRADLDRLLDHVARLGSVDTSGVSEREWSGGPQAGLRIDELHPGEPQPGEPQPPRESGDRDARVDPKGFYEVPRVLNPPAGTDEGEGGDAPA